MKNKTTAINFDQEADMLYPTLNKVEELLKEYQMVPVFYEVLADYMTPIRMFQALRKEGTPCFMLESVENKDQWEDIPLSGSILSQRSRFQEKN